MTNCSEVCRNASGRAVGLAAHIANHLRRAIRMKLAAKVRVIIAFAFSLSAEPFSKYTTHAGIGLFHVSLRLITSCDED